MKSKKTVSGKEFRVTSGMTILHSNFMHVDLTDDSYCKNGVLELPSGCKIGDQATQAVYKINVLKEYIC